MKSLPPPLADTQLRFALIDSPPILGLAKLIRIRTTELKELIVQAHASPDLAHTCMQMFHVLTALDQRDFALDMQAKALTQRVLYRMAGPDQPTIRLLALMAPGDMLDNTGFEFVIDNSDIQLDLLYLLPGQALPQTLPEHDLLIVAIGESDKNAPQLAYLDARLVDWPRPVLNPPHLIRHCARDTVYELLNDIPGLLVPATRRLSREQARQAALPFTIRPVDTQGGNGLVKVDSRAELETFFDLYSNMDYHVADFVDYRSNDGRYRKSRIALIDGQPYLCHLAVSEHWMVHYRSAGMALDADKRAEEASAMASFDADFAQRHQPVLQAIASRLGLDYVVLDCSETRDGRLLLFEADSRGWIHATDPVDLFPYKPAVMQKAFDAFRTMLLKRLQRP
ncbi:RimK family alpha-L-glutamate ligase [Rhodoferax sp.]|uniref:ATP-grasp domain-containing protein n=1 Tax=Rhodoferax sp. TaxID=50421 RepID=UPI002842FFA9|nr:RimK family alpha-L-glutamate ligase [Rhodoferax sp.]MDR3371317.1 RimK family alpha-L-glutamate ligase [Rhodoferax sp.]